MQNGHLSHVIVLKKNVLSIKSTDLHTLILSLSLPTFLLNFFCLFLISAIVSMIDIKTKNDGL